MKKDKINEFNAFSVFNVFNEFNEFNAFVSYSDEMWWHKNQCFEIIENLNQIFFKISEIMY
jgi:hypothetical protein